MVVAALAAVAAPAATQAHELSFPHAAGRSGDLGVKGMSEKKLRSFETAVFGPAHAAEHAQERKLVREGVSTTAAALPPPAQPAKSQYATQGLWEQPTFGIPVIGINAMMLPTGKVMWFAYPQNANQHWGNPNAPNSAQAWLWNPANGKYKRVNPPLARDPYDNRLKPANIWCAGQTFLQDGRVIVVGGNVLYARNGKPFTGLNKVYTFNPWNETWTEQQSMSHGRWYPSVSTLTDPQGHAVIVGGLNESAATNKYGDTYNPNLGIDLFTPTGDLDGKGTTTNLGNREDLRDNPNNDYHDPATHAPPDGGLYPHMFQSYNGGTLVAGPDLSDSWVLHQPGAGFNLASHGWDDLPSASRRRLWGTGVLVPPTTPGAPATKVDLLGGTVDETPANNTDADTGNTNTTEVLDQTAAGGAGAWQAGPSMNVHRSHLNTVLLPDSSMVSMGGGMGTTTLASFSNQWAVHDKGGSGNSAQDERFVDLLKPGAGSWVRGAPQNEDRAYHSTAILMPDARVVAAGDDYNGAGGPGTGISKDTAQIYDPPYLFNSNGDRATRPVITTVPPSLKYNTNFSLGYSNSDVAKAVLVAPGATTHANDMNQRVVPLQVNTSANGKASIKAPFLSGGAQPQNIAPPGYYMLFVLNSAGTPSVAKWVKVGANPPANAQIQLTQRTTGGSGAAFGLAGAPFDDVSLTNGHTTSAIVPGGPSTTVPGGHYTVTQAARSGFSLKSISCSGGSPNASLALRRVRINVAAGQTAHCTFTNAPNPAAKPSPGKAKPAPRDTTGPVLAFSTHSGLSGRRGLLSGRVRDGSGVKKVQVAVGVRRGRKCRWLSVRHKRFAGRSSCAKPRWINTKIKTKKGKLVWVARVHKRLRRGRYLVAIRAYDRKGNVTTLAGRKAKHVRVRR